MSLTRCIPLAILCGVVLLTGVTRGSDDVPNFRRIRELVKKKGEAAVVSETCVAIIKAARTSAKNPSLDRYELKKVEDRPNRTDLHIKGLFSGVVSGTRYEATIVVHLDTRDANIWEVLRIDYDDNSRNIVGPNRKNLEKLTKRFNGE